MPSAAFGAGGVIAIDTRVAVVTVKVMLPDLEPHTLATLQVAVIVALPGPTLLTSPPLLTVATAGFEEVQVRSALRFCVELSEKVPVAVNCRLMPGAMLGVVGVSAIDVRVAPVTVTMVLPVIEPHTLATLQVTVIVALPVPMVRTSPVLLTVATEGFEEVQIRSALRSCVELSEKVPVAVNCRLVPGAMLGDGGASAIDTMVAAVTVIVTVAEAEPQTLATAQVPVIVAVPGPTALILPLLLTAATDGLEEDQVRSALTSTWLLSLYSAVALSCVEVPVAILGVVESI